MVSLFMKKLKVCEEIKELKKNGEFEGVEELGKF